MHSSRTRRSILWAWAGLILAGLVLLGCGGPAPTAAPPTDGAGSQASPLPSATPVLPTALPVSVSVLPTETPAPLGLVVLHSNDNWGETEPCG